MASKNTNLCFTLFLLSVLVLCADFAVAKQDPELKQFDEKQKEECAKSCERYYKEKRQQEEQRGVTTNEGGEDQWDVESLEKKTRRCQNQCDERQLRGQERQLCRLRCQERIRRETESEDSYRREEQEEEEIDADENPYVFEAEHFSARVKTELGRIFELPKFTKKSNLLRGIENYRLALLVANPQSFISPTHLDADALFFVTWGRGTITMIRENKRESFNVEQGDMVMVPAGTPVYMVNRDDNEKFYMVKLLRPVNLPGNYEAFYGAGGENPESFFSAFDSDILAAAFNADRSKIERLFKKQNQGVIMKATKEQIKALTQSDETGGGIWPFGAESESRSSFNLFKQRRPIQSNRFGKLFEVKPNEFTPLQELNLMVSYANITKGAMHAPFYNSKATKIAIVVAGEGYIEIACPHFSRGDRSSKSGSSYQKMRSRIKTDSVFVVPAGHPFVTVASKDQNLEIACFEVNAQGNVRFPLAGKRNIVNLMEKEAKELAFNAKRGEVDQVFAKQNEEFFFPGPTRQQGEGRADE